MARGAALSDYGQTEKLQFPLTLLFGWRSAIPAFPKPLSRVRPDALMPVASYTAEAGSGIGSIRGLAWPGLAWPGLE
jgi:hypothetical protein